MEKFSALLALCAGNSPVSGEFPTQRPVTRSFDVFFDLCLIKRLSKRSRGWWFETLSRPLWRHCNARYVYVFAYISISHHVTVPCFLLAFHVIYSVLFLRSTTILSYSIDVVLNLFVIKGSYFGGITLIISEQKRSGTDPKITAVRIAAGGTSAASTNDTLLSS